MDKNRILITKAVDLKIVLILSMSLIVICTKLVLRHALADCAYMKLLNPEEVSNIFHFCNILQQNIMLYYIEVAFLICSYAEVEPSSITGILYKIE